MNEPRWDAKRKLADDILRQVVCCCGNYRHHGIDWMPEGSGEGLTVALALLDQFAAEARLEEHKLTCHKALLQYSPTGKLIGNLRCGEDWECERRIELTRLSSPEHSKGAK